MTTSFATTRWTLVLAAARRPRAQVRDPAADPLQRQLPTSTVGAADSHAERALAELCRTYWPPLYAHARRRGLAPADAEDAVQGFFARLLRLDSLGAVSRERGRFRAFLLGSFNHYLADLRDHARAAKRGAHLLASAPFDSAAAAAAEAAFAAAPSPDLPPDRAFDRAWALALLAAATDRLAAEQTEAGRAEQFAALRPALGGRSRDVPHAALAAQLGLSEAAVRVAVHRLRTRFRALLHAEVAETVARPEDIDDELRHLIAVLSA